MSRAHAREETRARVVATAARCFDAAGYEATTIRGIAAAAGVSVGTVMANGDKQTLLVAAFDSRIARLHARRSEGDANPPGDEFCASSAITAEATGEAGEARARANNRTDELVELVAPFIRLFAERPELSRHYAAVLVSGTHRSTIFDELSWMLRDEFGETLARRAESDLGTASEELLQATAATLYAAYLGVLFAASGSGEIDERQIRDRLRTVFSVIVGEAGQTGEGS